MSYKRYNIHRFTCDGDDDCHAKLFVRVRSKRYAIKQLREAGWSSPSYDEHVCPDHNTKDPVDDEDPHFNVDTEPPSIY